MQLHTLNKITDRKKKIVGRGAGSGKGMHTSGRGSKGQKARAGSHIRTLFEGGQNPLTMRIPHKKGFLKHTKTNNEIITLSSLNIFDDGAAVSVADLFKTGIITGKGTPKVLDEGTITKKVNLIGISCSKTAKEKIEKLEELYHGHNRKSQTSILYPGNQKESFIYSIYPHHLSLACKHSITGY